MLMLSGPVELLFLLFLIAARTCSVVMFICVGCRLSVTNKSCVISNP